MIYDCFLFNNENDLLDIRINELSLCDDWVTHILVEADKTFTGNPKPFYFDSERFHKRTNIFRLQIDDMPEGTPWDRERHQRNAIMKALSFLEPKPDDKVIISDADEIPRAKQVNKFKPVMGFASLIMDKYCYFLNVVENRQSWDRARIMTWQYLKRNIPDNVRNSGYDFSIHDAGWHWSWLGGIDAVKEKLDSFSHQELNTGLINCTLKDNLNSLKTLQGLPLELTDINLSHPEYLFKNQEKFSHLIK